MSASDIDVVIYRLSALEKKIDESIAEQRLVFSHMDTRVRGMESIMDQLKGAGTAGKALWAFIGAGGISIIAGIVGLVVSKK